jgi:hypothetical protein
MKEEDFDGIEFIDESLLTEDGFLNPVCINKLNSFILHLPKSYERLANDGEWNVKKWTGKKDILGSFAKWACCLSPYGCPNGLDKVINYLSVCLDKDIIWNDCGRGIKLAELSLCEINKVLYDILYEQGITIFDNWNKPKKDWRKEGLDEFPQNDSDYDFISLDALLHGVCLDIRNDRRIDKLSTES